jgi:preprotein translocase subunit Sec63
MSQFHPDKFAGEIPELVQTMEETTKRLNTAYTYLERNFMAR